MEHRELIAQQKRAAFRNESYWGKPLTGFGDVNARLLIVGLAPAAHGGNRTGRIFTGDSSGRFLMQGLHHAGFANQPESVHAKDGLKLIGAYMLAAVRCAPPDNRPTPTEIVNCRSFLLRETALLPNIKTVLALGKIALDAYIDALRAHGYQVSRPKFQHGAEYSLPTGQLFVSYHPSQQNTQTGRLTAEMFQSVLVRVKQYLN